MSSSVLTDLSGRPLPAHGTTSSAVDRVIAVPPIRDVPNQNAVEFSFSVFKNVAAGAVGIQMNDPTVGPTVPFTVGDAYRGRIDQFIVYAPDLIMAAAPFLFWHMLVNGAISGAWGTVPVYPATTLSIVTFSAQYDLAPNSVVRFQADNNDGVNSHELAVFVHGWTWPKDVVEG